jgi:hypothetical protein
MLIDSGNTHNFINWCKAQDKLHCFVHPVNNFQFLIANGGLMMCGGHYLNVKLQMGDYHLKTHMFVVDIGGCDIVLGAEWLRTSRPVTMDFK